MRIAIVTEVFLPKVDGITNRIDHTIKELSSMGHDIGVFAPDSATREHPAARIFRYPSLAFKPYPGVRITLPSLRLIKELYRFRPDVVHLVGPACLGVWGAIASKLIKRPLVSSYHTDFPQYLPLYGLGWARSLIWRAIRLIHNASMLNLCPSLHTKKELTENGVTNIHLWRGGIDTARFHPRKHSLAMRERLTKGEPKRAIALYVGRVSHEKSVTELQHIHRVMPHVQIAVVGAGPALGCLQKALGHERVTYTGVLRDEELAQAYASADVFVMPSRTETLGFVTLEAMSSGLPVIGAGAGGTKELILESNGGIIYDPLFPKNLGLSVQSLLEDEALRLGLARRARAYAVNYTWQQESRNLCEHYRSVLEAHGALKSKRAMAGNKLSVRVAYKCRSSI